MLDFTNFPKLKNDFINYNDEFTVFLVEHDYFKNKGKNFFSQFLYTENWFCSDEGCYQRINEMLSWLEKNNAKTSDLIEELRNISNNQSSKANESITILTKLYGTTSHKIPIPKTLNPIIIEEGNISNQNIVLLVSLQKYCNDIPTTIFLLKDNNFDRAEKIFLQCPNDTNLKMIKNIGEFENKKVLNEGAKSVEEFLKFFSSQCFNTCSKTESNILLSEDWAKNDVICKFSPKLFKIRSTFVSEHKLEAKEDIQKLGLLLCNYEPIGANNQLLTNGFLCMNNLFQVYCNDFGGQQIDTALSIAKSLDNEILLAHVYRYSHFFKNCDRHEKQELLNEAERIFSDNGITDHAIYCNNNSLIHQFSMDKINIKEFEILHQKALTTPELFLMAHIINNVGVAYMFQYNNSKAIDIFNSGLEYAKNNPIQELALKSNCFAAKYLCYGSISITEAEEILKNVFIPSLGFDRMPFLTAQFALNVISVVAKNNLNNSKKLITKYRVIELVQAAFNSNIMGTGSMIAQLKYFERNYINLNLLCALKIPGITTDVSGLRKNYIEKYGINPFFFNTWL